MSAAISQMNNVDLLAYLANYKNSLNTISSSICKDVPNTNNIKSEPVKKITLFVEKNKEEINSMKTSKQLQVEQNGLLFKRYDIKDKLYCPYRTGNDAKEKRYVDMFNFVLISREGRREGKVKYLNQIIDVDTYKQNSILQEITNDNAFSKDKKETEDKMIIALKKRKINDLRIYARDMKIAGYSTMNKDDLIKNIVDIFAKKNKLAKPVKPVEKKTNENVKVKNTKKTISELEKECGIDNNFQYDENDLNGINDENIPYDDDDDTIGDEVEYY